MSGHLRHRGRSAKAESLRPDLDAIIEKAREADQPLRPAHVLLQKLHHVGAAGDVLGRCIVAAGLCTQGECGFEIAWAV
jgi:hypothetical protein